MTTPTTGPADAMRVERCAGCGARYNVTRLAPGSRFACRRCGAAVVVGAGGDAPGAPLASPSGVASLVVAGVLAVLATALRVVPGGYAAGPDTSVTASLAALTLPDAVALALLATTGGLALVAAARPASRGLRVALATAVVVLVARAHGPATPALRTTAPDLAGAVALALLGGAALVLASPRPETRRAARPWTWVGALLLVAAAASRFAAGSEGTASLLTRRGDAARALLTAVWRGTPAPDGLSVAYGVVPDLATATAVACLGLVALWPGRRGGALSRVAGRAAVALLVLAHLAGPVATAWDGRDRWLAEGGLAVVAAQASAAAFEGGLVAWLLAAAALAGLAQPRGGAPRGPAGSGGFLALAAVASVGTAALLADPSGPAPALLEHLRATVGSLASAGPTEPAVGVTLAVALAAAAALALLVAPLRGRGAFVGGFAAAAACGADLATSVDGTPRVAFAALAALAAGTAWARRGPRWDGRGRALVTAAAVAIVALLLFPARAPGEAEGPLPFPCALSTWADAVVRTTPATLGAFLADSTAATVTFALLAAAFAALAAAVGPRRPIVVALGTVAVAAALHPPVSAFLATLTAARDATAGPPLADALGAAAAGLRHGPAAALLAGIACGADAAGGRPRPI
ncbi:MAG: hypothetical protein U1E39_15640 [Planctomycetota bacterium]